MAQLAISKTQKRLFIVLAVVGAYAMYEVLTSGSRGPRKQAAVSVPITVDNKTSNATSAELMAPGGRTVASPVSYTTWKRDPFGRVIRLLRPPVDLSKIVEVASAPQTDRFSVSAISSNGTRSFAIINNQIVGVGDRVDGYTIVEIQDLRVVMQKDNFRFTLLLPEGD